MIIQNSVSDNLHTYTYTIIPNHHGSSSSSSKYISHDIEEIWMIIQNSVSDNLHTHTYTIIPNHHGAAAAAAAST
jgi:hypothetical protein